MQYDSKAEFPCGPNCDWRKDICDNNLIIFLSPFAFDVSNTLYNGINQCPWPHNNSILRITTNSLIKICTILSIAFITCFKAYKGMHKYKWRVLKYTYLLLVCLSFSSMVLDSQSLKDGYVSCKNKFKINGRNILYNAYDIKNCYLSPYINIIYCDIGVVLFTVLSFRIHGLIPGDLMKQTLKAKKNDDYTNLMKSGSTSINAPDDKIERSNNPTDLLPPELDGNVNDGSHGDISHGGAYGGAYD